jgi:hypothetical protein
MRFLIIIGSLFFSFSAFAQNDLPTGQIEVIKDFEVRLMEVRKIRIVPSPVAIDSTVRHYEYKLTAPSPTIEYTIPELKPLALEPEQKPTYYPLFAKAGYGSPNSLLLMGSYDHTQNDFMDWGIDFRHLSANNKKIPLQQFSDSQARINGSYLLSEKVQLQGYIDGHYETVYFYGADVIPGNPDALRRRFNRYDVMVTASNVIESTPSVRYAGFFNYLFDKDDLGSKERGLRIGGEGAFLIGADENPLGLRLLADLTKFQHTEEHSLNNILAEPFFEVRPGQFKIHLGGKVLLKKEQNEILPDLEISYHIPSSLLTFFAGWKGEVKKNNFHSLSSYNPFIHLRLDSITNSISRSLYGGVKGITGIFNYEFKGGYTSFERRAFFLQDSEDHEQFNPVYDDGSYIELEGAVYFTVLKNVRLRSNAFTHFYSLDNEEKPWHRPSFGIDAEATYTGGSDQYHVSILFHGEDALPFRTPGGTISTLDPLLDFNIHGDYFITPSIGAFLELNNILGNNRERWATYPSFGFNAKAGIVLRIP